jgi:hypothetical protein
MSHKHDYAIETAYLAVENEATGEKVLVQDPKIYYTKQVATSVLRLLPDSEKKKVIEGQSFSTVDISNSQITQASFLKKKSIAFECVQSF